jgi:hypothetical protein
MPASSLQINNRHCAPGSIARAGGVLADMTQRQTGRPVAASFVQRMTGTIDALRGCWVAAFRSSRARVMCPVIACPLAYDDRFMTSRCRCAL